MWREREVGGTTLDQNRHERQNDQMSSVDFESWCEQAVSEKDILETTGKM